MSNVLTEIVEHKRSEVAEAKRLPAIRLESRITQNDAKIAAYAELRALLGDLSSAVAGLRNPPGFLGQRSNLFEAKEAYFSSSTTTSPATLLAVTPDATADTGSYEIVVHQLAATPGERTGSSSIASSSCWRLNSVQ